MKYVVAKSGWWSGVFRGLQNPLRLVLAQLAKEPGVKTFFATWHDHKGVKQSNSKAVAWVRSQYKPGDKIVLLGHSYGASAITWDAAQFAAAGLNVDLLIAEDQGLDSIFIVDKRIGHNVLKVLELRVLFERLSFAPNWRGKHRFEQLPRAGGHTPTFVKPAMVNRIVKEIKEC